MSKEPRAVLVEEGGSEHWKIELKNFKQFRDALGPDVMNAFCRCFVWADRLASLISFAYVSQNHHGPESVAFNRNLQTMVWFTIGTLRELATAIRDLRSALAKRGMLDPQSAPWIKLRDIEGRWEDDPFYRNMRNVAAFHVDPDVMEKGLSELATNAMVEPRANPSTGCRRSLDCWKRASAFPRFGAWFNRSRAMECSRCARAAGHGRVHSRRVLHVVWLCAGKSCEGHHHLSESKACRSITA